MKEDNNTISIKNIEVLNYSVNPKPKDSPTKLQYTVHLESATKVNAEKNLIFIIITVSVWSPDSKYNMATITASIPFELSNFGKVAKLQKDLKYTIDPEMEKTLTIISIDTLRGIVFAYFRGSYLHNIIIPLIDGDQLKRDI